MTRMYACQCLGTRVQARGLLVTLVSFNSFSTPKSCRQKMCSTPPPPASPISSVDGTPASKLLSDEEFLKECVPLNGGHLHEVQLT